MSDWVRDLARAKAKEFMKGLDKEQEEKLWGELQRSVDFMLLYPELIIEEWIQEKRMESPESLASDSPISRGSISFVGTEKELQTIAPGPTLQKYLKR